MVAAEGTGDAAAVSGRTWEMRGNLRQEKSVNPRSWKPAGMAGLFWINGRPEASRGSCLCTSALWRSSPRCVRKVTQHTSHLCGESQAVSRVAFLIPASLPERSEVMT